MSRLQYSKVVSWLLLEWLKLNGFTLENSENYKNIKIIRKLWLQ